MWVSVAVWYGLAACCYADSHGHHVSSEALSGPACSNFFQHVPPQPNSAGDMLINCYWENGDGSLTGSTTQCGGKRPIIVLRGQENKQSERNGIMAGFRV